MATRIAVLHRLWRRVPAITLFAGSAILLSSVVVPGRHADTLFVAHPDAAGKLPARNPPNHRGAAITGLSGPLPHSARGRQASITANPASDI